MVLAKKTKNMLLIESVFSNDLEVLLKQWYIEQRMSDSQIVNFLKNHNLEIFLQTIWRWCKQLGIVSRSTNQKFEKTPKMFRLEIAMGGQECDKIIPWLWSLGKTSGEIIEFLNSFTTSDVLSRSTLGVWLRAWGCCPDEQASIRRSNAMKRYYTQHPKTKIEISLSLKKFFKSHPEAADNHTRVMSDFYAKNPEIRQRSSHANKQRWARQKAARFCPLISENLAEDLCKDLQDFDCKDCSFYSKEVKR